jgi:rod shape determining protein RodA
MNWNSKLLKNLNWYIPVCVLLLIIIGLIAISSAVEINKANSPGRTYLWTQIIAAVFGILVVIAIQFFDYSVLKHYANLLYLSTLGILGLILVIGRTISGGKRWIELGPVNFQPSELAKIILVIMLAAILDEKKKELKYLTGFFQPFLFSLIIFALIIMQNDLGTALVLLIIFIGMLYLAGGNARFMAIIFGGGLGLIILMITCHVIFDTPLFFFKGYQIDRLIVFMNPGFDPTGIGYNLIQSKIALGSGQFMGKGLFAGTQNQLAFLPEKHNDFIFSVIGEEFGFIGVVTVIGIYFLLLWQIFDIAIKARDNYGTLVASGIGIMFFFHVLENVGMTMGLMPITGITLPFISYGGSSMVISMMAIGLVINVNLRRKKIVF